MPGVPGVRNILWGNFAVRLSFTTQPQAVNAGATMSSVVVKALTAGGVVDAGFTGTITVALTTPGSATLGGTVAVAAVAGVATFDDLVVTGETGSRTLTATATGLTSATSDSFTVSVLDPATLDNLAYFWSADSGVTGVAGSGTILSAASALPAGEGVEVAGVQLVAGTDFTASATAATQAENILQAINAHPTLSPIVLATRSSATVTVTRLVTTLDAGITLAKVGTATALTLGGNQYDSVAGRIMTAAQPWESSGGADLDQSAAASKPLYSSTGGALGGPVILGRGASGQHRLELSSPTVTAAPFCVYAIYKNRQTVTDVVVSLAQNAGWDQEAFCLGVSSGTGVPFWQSIDGGVVSTASAGSGATKDGNVHLIEGRELASNSRTCRIDGGTEGTNTTSSTPSGIDILTALARWRSGVLQSGCVGDLAAVIVLSANRTASQFNQIGQYAVLTHGVPSVALVAA